MLQEASVTAVVLINSQIFCNYTLMVHFIYLDSGFIKEVPISDAGVLLEQKNYYKSDLSLQLQDKHNFLWT